MWDQQNYFVIRGLCYIWPLYNEVPLYMKTWKIMPLKVPRNPTNFAFICTQVGLILDIFLFFVCKKHYFEK